MSNRRDDDLQIEARALRAALRDVEVPAALAGRLLRIPGETSRRVRSPFLRFLAAAVLLAAAALGGTLVAGRARTRITADRLLRTAAADHLRDRHVTVATSDDGAFAAALRPTLPFAPVVPDVGSALTLAGGRTCALAEQPIAYSLWRGAEGEASLSQFAPAVHGLPGDLAPRRATVRSLTDERGRSRTVWGVVWIEDGRGYVLVADAPALLPGGEK